MAKYWKNGTVVTLPAKNDLNQSDATSIAVSVNDIYAAGRETPNVSPYLPLPRCWVNNTEIALANGTGGKCGYATGIAIVK